MLRKRHAYFSDWKRNLIENDAIAFGDRTLIIPSFVIGRPVPFEESRSCEFKEIRPGQNPIKEIVDDVGIYAVAYLNDKGGHIYWGITNEGIVSGVSLDAPQRDQLRQAITNKLNTTQPAVAPTMYEVTLHPIYPASEGNNPLPDCFVVEVVIPASVLGDLYLTAAGEAHVKTDSGKMKLSPAQLKDEIERRVRQRKPLAWLDTFGGSEPSLTSVSPTIIREEATVRLVQTLEGHTGPVFHVDFSPDGHSLASAGGDGFVRVWEITVGVQVRTLGRHILGVSAIAFSPDGLFLASGTTNCARLWSIATGKMTREFWVAPDTITELAFSPNGRMLATAGSEVLLWNTHTGEQLTRLEISGKGVLDMAFSTDGRSLAVVDDSLLIFDLEKQQAKRFSWNNERVQAIAYSPDGKRLAVGLNTRIRLLDAVQGIEMMRFSTLPYKGIGQLAFNYPDGSLLVSGDLDHKLRIWNLDGRELARIDDHAFPVYGLAVSRDEQTLATACGEQTVRIWSLESS